MRTLRKLAWVEIKLFLREPTTAVFTFALPIITLFVLGEVFGHQAESSRLTFPGGSAMTYYVPAYIGLVISSIGLIGLPVHLAAYRERGVLRRLHASAVSFWSVFGSQVLVSMAIAALGGMVLGAAAALRYDVGAPARLAGVAAAFVVGSLSFTALGMFLGSVLPTARAAQAAGLLLFFVMMFVSGAGPPPQVMSEAMRQVGEGMLLKHVIALLQAPWLGLDWSVLAWLVVTSIMLAAAALAFRLFRWE